MLNAPSRKREKKTGGVVGEEGENIYKGKFMQILWILVAFFFAAVEIPPT